MPLGVQLQTCNAGRARYHKRRLRALPAYDARGDGVAVRAVPAVREREVSGMAAALPRSLPQRECLSLPPHGCRGDIGQSTSTNPRGRGSRAHSHPIVQHAPRRAVHLLDPFGSSSSRKPLWPGKSPWKPSAASRGSVSRMPARSSSLAGCSSELPDRSAAVTTNRNSIAFGLGSACAIVSHSNCRSHGRSTWINAPHRVA